MAVNVSAIGTHSYQLSYQSGDTFKDVITALDNTIKSFGFSKIDEDSNGNWAVWKKTAYDTKTSYCIRIGNNNGAVYLELYEDWDVSNHKGTNGASNSIYRSDNLNGNQRFDNSDGGLFYIYVSDKWFSFVSKTPKGTGDLRWGSFTGVFERERKTGETPDLYNYPPVVYLCAGQMVGGWSNYRKVGYVRIYHLGSELKAYSDNGSWTNGVMLYARGYHNPTFSYKDDILDKYPVFNLSCGIDDYIYGKIYGIKQIAGNTGQLMDVAVITCDDDLFASDSGTDTEHWIVPQGGFRFVFPK